MDPQFNQTPGLRLPQPSVDAGTHSTYPSQHMPQPQHFTSQPVPLPQTAPIQQSQASQEAIVAPSTVPQIQTTPLDAQQPTPIETPNTSPASEDSDDSDEVWTNKVNSITSQYKADPYMQSRALAKLKAEYLQTKHGKSMKVDEG